MSVCQSNPLNTLVSKSGYGFGQPNHQQSLGQHHSRNGRPGNSVLDQQFSQFSGAPAAFGHAPQLPVAAAAAKVAAAQAAAAQAGLSSSSRTSDMSSQGQVWIDQFANMQVRDRTEFSAEYKSMYSQYEARGAYSTGAPAMNVPRSQMLDRQRPVMMGHQLATHQAHAQTHAHTISTRLDEQFAELERQVHDEEQNQDEDYLKETSPLDDDQLQLKEAAQSIYTTLSDTTASNKSKFSNSKFLGLMRNISDGVITLKKNPDHDTYTELYSPSTGETFGEEYFPVQDSVLGDPLDSIGDLSNMSSSEAAAKVYHQQ
ncbi:unnamed protein product [Kluyveromyces dobzhanskii CBS 2104]|uniref:WGS project CCBQ000000000 data, contig 00046 n=1 Tax=Kluyveromyces dobzhanskii CBS 2104 TaxID=1427455 RepID=A0A0A8L6X6_9SACH|nr:unnamed protein product [Kluyveromyces dobzhanskii CBS 2104]